LNQLDVSYSISRDNDTDVTSCKITTLTRDVCGIEVLMGMPQSLHCLGIIVKVCIHLGNLGVPTWQLSSKIVHKVIMNLSFPPLEY
jgi:hypothetical protein